LDPDALAFARAATFAVLDDDNRPVCCGFFIAANVAMSVFHDSKPKVGAKLKGLSFLGMSEDERETHEFTVTETNKNLDFIILHRTKQRAKPCFFELMEKVKDLTGSPMYRIGCGMSAAARVPEVGSASFALEKSHIHLVSSSNRHFIYNDASGVGDSGGAVILVDGRFVGMHLGG
jgi:hypothetical protein